MSTATIELVPGAASLPSDQSGALVDDLIFEEIVSDFDSTDLDTVVAPEAPKSWKRWVTGTSVGLALAGIVGAGILFGLPAENGLEPSGVTALAVIIPGIILWMTAGMNWVSLLIIGMFVISGIAPNGGAGNPWAGSLGNPIVALVITWYILANVLSETNVIDNIAAWFISRPFLKGRPLAFMTVFFASQMFIGIVMQNLAIGVIYLGLAEKICDRLGLQKGDKLYTALMSGINWGNAVVMCSSPIAKTWPLVMIGLLTAQGVSISIAQWLLIGIPFTFVMVAVIALCVKVINPDITPLKDLDIDQFRRETPPMNRAGIIASISMVILISFIVIPEILSVFGMVNPVIDWIVSIGITAPAIVAVSALCLIKVDGKPVCDFVKSLHSIHWGVILFVAAIMLISGPFTNPYTGIQAWMGNVFQPVFQGVSPFMIIALATVVALVLSQFMANGLTMTVLWTIGSVLLLDYSGITHLAGLAIALCFGASMAVLTGPASLMPALLFEPGHLTVKNSWKANVVFIAVSGAVILAMLPFINLVVPS